MKLTSILLLAASGIALAQQERAEALPLKDLRELKYANSVPISRIAVERRAAAAAVGTKDNRNLGNAYEEARRQ
ncbi:hypothetical protein S7711_11455 [Stachybotrys chartarum IBT 7711]|uniref:Uncharacterized protein n=1 Tax=Stachybotrys chartarum (strain CBS 109288 / IBT 7711) TaxID=1280523 RepID=A0A084AVL9_STACB|nr:hypothetical protein S7711_11455 [Stachybotrys chartarum IBT 7711]KFA54676.1 hypothetical protein S40293_11572 [Stachybotrys chartarum IBT 40293]KFA78919.1 hypothetical protein S40288_11394 [Stachybotrys chartarum IBT 40288]